jgi:hypothetical protein
MSGAILLNAVGLKEFKMLFKHVRTSLLSGVVAGALAMALLPSSGATRAATDAVTVMNQSASGNRVVISKVEASKAGWMVIHATSEGAPGIGMAYVPAGMTENVVVSLDASMVTPELIAMLHVDDGTAGKYEFDGKSGLDAPARVGDQLVAPRFKAISVHVGDQFVTDTVVVETVVAQKDGFIVIHSGAENSFAAIGNAPITAGVNKNVEVKVDATKVTPSMSAMIHDDTGEVGKYEFDGKNGLDLPARGADQAMPAALGGGIINEVFMTVETVRAMDQVVTDMVMLPSVLAKADGFIVIHATSEGNPGIGVAPVKAGHNHMVMVSVDPAKVTPTVLAMLHDDTGEKGKYEFDGKNGLDLPVKDAAGKVIAPALATTNHVRVADQKMDVVVKDGVVVVTGVTAKANGFIVIHATSEGFPGIGVQFVPAGHTMSVIVKVDASKLTDSVLAMLHEDTGAAGVYEFDGKNGLDLPVKDAAGKVIAPPIALAK